jgi:hypothetical protein
MLRNLARHAQGGAGRCRDASAETRMCGGASGKLIVRWQSWTRVPRFGPAFRMGESMEGDDQKLQRLKHIAGNHGYDIVLLPEGDDQPAAAGGWSRRA